MSNSIYLIPEYNLAELESRIEKLNRRCRKLGVEEITLAKAPDHVRHRVRQLTVDGRINSQSWRKSLEKDPNPGNAFLANAFEPTGEVMAWWAITVTGETPSLSGWSFVAVLEPMVCEDGAVLNLVQCLPGESCPAEFRSRIGQCDHCKASRDRKQTFVLRHADGSHKCVGRQCIKDFLGYNADPHALASAAELMAELGALCEAAGDDEWLGGGFSRERSWDLRHFLALTACRIRLFGWLGRGKAREMREEGRDVEATADKVLELLTPPSARIESEKAVREWEAFSAKHVQEDADSAKAESAIEWAKGISAAELESSDYLGNVNLIARVGTVGRKTAGIAASVIVAYDRAMEREVKIAAMPESHHIGEVGKRIEFLEVTCAKVIRSEGVYGVTGIHKLTDAAGNDLTWFASEGAGWIKEGDTVTVSATVKSHGEFKGRKQTVLTRVSTWEPEGLATAKAKAAKKAARLAKRQMVSA